MTTFREDYIKDRLRSALQTARQPHYGCNDTEIDHLWEAVHEIEGLLLKLEDPTEDASMNTMLDEVFVTALRRAGV